ncbi:cytochrome P450 [Nocardioides marmoriginsengisoli]|uniref:Cytochrome P450 n=2 Tax=Nocardioides marmoriginsengisoli TaxID=661483 RepID=A0A3N0CCY8_9ACTN|nr:cytochrome P450 [Nocardioides marmoriginsengisoli]
MLAIDPKIAADPFPTYELLRGADPIVRGPVVSSTVDHQAANEILRSDDFGTAAGHAELPPFLRRVLERVADPYSLSPVDKPSLLALDPPDHTRHRKLVARAFTARRITALEDRVTSVAEKLLDELDGGSFDLVERYAARLPVAVIADLLGVPEEQHDWLLDWGNRAAITLDPGLTFREFRDAETALRRMHHWFDEHVAQLRRNPGDDLLSQLALIDGEDALTDLELRAIGLLVLGAGFETTVNLIGNAVVNLAAHPEQRDLLVAEPERWPNAVEEVLRYDSPVQLTVRSALRDTVVAGTPVPEGLGILVLLGGVNRDPKVFTDPQAFDVTRANPDQHLSFSAGVHFCLGASLARLEAVTALRTLYARYPDLELAEAPVRRGTRVLHGYEQVRVMTGSPVPA